MFQFPFWTQNLSATENLWAGDQKEGLSLVRKKEVFIGRPLRSANWQIIAQRLEWRGQTQKDGGSNPSKVKFSTYERKTNRINILLIVHHLLVWFPPEESTQSEKFVQLHNQRTYPECKICTIVQLRTYPEQRPIKLAQLENLPRAARFSLTTISILITSLTCIGKSRLNIFYLIIHLQS